MDWILLFFGFLLILAGIAGAFLPVIPGPPLSFGGLFLFYFTRWSDLSLTLMVMLGILAAVVTVLDYIVPVWGTKKLGGSKAGVRGSMIGLFVGLFFFPPFGLIVGPLIGGVVAELIVNRHDFSIALRTGLGSLAGFMLGTGMKLFVALLMAYYFVHPFLSSLY